MYLCECVFFWGQYMKFYFNKIFSNLSFLMTNLENISRAATAKSVIGGKFLFYFMMSLFLLYVIVFNLAKTFFYIYKMDR